MFYKFTGLISLQLIQKGFNKNLDQNFRKGF